MKSAAKEALKATAFTAAVIGFFLWVLSFGPSRQHAPVNVAAEPASDVVAVFRGGKFGDREVTHTPEFKVENDWWVEVEMKGDFWRATLAPQLKIEPNPKAPMSIRQLAYNASFNIYDAASPSKSFRREFTDGGKFSIYFEGNGVWKVTIHQGSGAIP